MNETLAKFWLFATHWTELDVFETEEELNDEIELLHRQNLPTKDQQGGQRGAGALRQTGRPRLRPLLHGLAAWDVKQKKGTQQKRARKRVLFFAVQTKKTNLTIKMNFVILFSAHRRAVST